MGVLKEILILATLSMLLTCTMSCQKGLYAFLENGKLGYKNKRGKVIIPAYYADCVFSTLDSPCYEEYAKDEYVPIQAINQKYGVLDFRGKVLVPFIYDFLTDEFDSTFIVKNNNESAYRLIDLNNDIVIDAGFSSEFYIDSKSVFSGKIKNTNIIYDPILNEIVDTVNYRFVSIFVNGLAKVSDDYKRWGIIDTQNNLVLDPTYLEIGQNYFDSLLVVKDTSSHYYVIDINGNKLSSNYDGFNPYYSDRGRFKIMNRNGQNYLLEELIPIDSLEGVNHKFLGHDFISYNSSATDQSMILYRIHDGKEVYKSDVAFEFYGNYLLVNGNSESAIYVIEDKLGEFKLKLLGVFEGKSDNFYGHFPFLTYSFVEESKVYSWRNKRMKPLFSFAGN